MKDKHNIGRNSFIYINLKVWSKLCAEIWGVKTVRVSAKKKTVRKWILAQY